MNLKLLINEIIEYIRIEFKYGIPIVFQRSRTAKGRVFAVVAMASQGRYTTVPPEPEAQIRQSKVSHFRKMPSLGVIDPAPSSVCLLPPLHGYSHPRHVEQVSSAKRLEHIQYRACNSRFGKRNPWPGYSLRHPMRSQPRQDDRFFSYWSNCACM